MKQFLEELEKHPEAYQIKADTTEKDRIRQEMMVKYKPYVGKRALYTCKSTKEKRVVTIDKLYSNFIQVSYKYYGDGYSGRCSTSILYNSLYCGSDSLEIE